MKKNQINSVANPPEGYLPSEGNTKYNKIHVVLQVFMLFGLQFNYIGDYFSDAFLGGSNA